MKSEIKVPSMGESISEVIIGSILVSSGHSIKAGEEILELETDKVNQLLYAPQTGVLTLNVRQGETVKIGQVIGTIDVAPQAEQKSSPSLPPTGTTAPISSMQATKEEREKSPVPSSKPLPTITSESARETREQFIQELGQKPQPTSAVAEIKKEAPKQETPKKEVSKNRETRRKMSRIRQVIADRLVEVGQKTAMLTTFNEVDLSEVMELREKYKETFSKKYGVKLGFMSFFVKACVAALKSFPDINSYIEGDEIVHREYYDMGIAVGTDRGVIVPVVRQCDQLSFAEIEQSIESFAKKARESTLTFDDLQGAGFTITNGGVYGSLLSTPILIPPQSGILGMHKIEKRPVVINDQIVIRPMMYLALSYDHRIVDGKEAVSFLVHIKNSLEDPSRLLLNI